MRPTELDPHKDYIFTIGHSSMALDEFVSLLHAYGIEGVADVRSQPYSRYAPQFSRAPLEAHLEQAGITYEFMGHQLGGRPEGVEFYDDDGFVRYKVWAEDERFLDGIATLESVARRRRWAVLCAEANPQACHRHLLVARVLARRGWPTADILHIQPNGTCVADGSFPAQDDLFGGDVSWRSPQSVLHKVRQSVSLRDLGGPEYDASSTSG